MSEKTWHTGLSRRTFVTGATAATAAGAATAWLARPALSATTVTTTGVPASDIADPATAPAMLGHPRLDIARVDRMGAVEPVLPADTPRRIRPAPGTDFLGHLVA